MRFFVERKDICQDCGRYLEKQEEKKEKRCEMCISYKKSFQKLEATALL